MIPANDQPPAIDLQLLSPLELERLLPILVGLVAHYKGDIETSLRLRRMSNALERCDAAATMRGIILDVALEHGLSVDQVLHVKTRAVFAHARWDAMHRMREVKRPNGSYRYSLPMIAAALGLRDHTTVIRGLRRHEEMKQLAERRAAQVAA